MPGPPSRPADSIPIPPIHPMQIAPPLGKRSDVTANIVGQRNVLPHAYTVAAITQRVTDVAPPRRRSPVRPSTPLRQSKPRGEILCTIGPAKNLRVNISDEV